MLTRSKPTQSCIPSPSQHHLIRALQCHRGLSNTKPRRRELPKRGPPAEGHQQGRAATAPGGQRKGREAEGATPHEVTPRSKRKKIRIVVCQPWKFPGSMLES